MKLRHPQTPYTNTALRMAQDACEYQSVLRLVHSRHQRGQRRSRRSGRVSRRYRVAFDGSPETHIRTTHGFLQRLRENNLNRSPLNMTIETTPSTFRGHPVNPDDTRLNANNAATLTTMPMPTTVKHLGFLLGEGPHVS